MKQANEGIFICFQKWMVQVGPFRRVVKSNFISRVASAAKPVRIPDFIHERTLVYLMSFYDIAMFFGSFLFMKAFSFLVYLFNHILSSPRIQEGFPHMMSIYVSRYWSSNLTTMYFCVVS